MTHILMVTAALFTLLASALTAEAKEMPCPDPPAQFTKDGSVRAEGAIGALGRLKAGELAIQTQSVTKPLFDNVPNSDRFLVAQSLISLFCRVTAASSLPDTEKMDRLHVFTEEIMAFVANVDTPRKGANPPDTPGKKGPRAAVPPAANPAPKHSADFEKYIDPTARRSDDKRNVTFSVLDYDGADVRSLEGAAQRALRERGYNVVPLFRAGFTKDEVGRTLFTGSPSIAGRLELGKHCDSVLLGQLRLVGPVSSLNGLYITDWVLEIRVISPESGAITDQREVEEKGAGSSPEASKANAVRKLRSSVESQLAVWSWT